MRIIFDDGMFVQEHLVYNCLLRIVVVLYVHISQHSVLDVVCVECEGVEYLTVVAVDAIVNVVLLTVLAVFLLFEHTVHPSVYLLCHLHPVLVLLVLLLLKQLLL